MVQVFVDIDNFVKPEWSLIKFEQKLVDDQKKGSIQCKILKISYFTDKWI